MAPWPIAPRVPSQPNPSVSKQQSGAAYSGNQAPQVSHTQSRQFCSGAQWNGTGRGFSRGFVQMGRNCNRRRALGWGGSRYNCAGNFRGRGRCAQPLTGSMTSCNLRNFASGASQGIATVATQQGASYFQPRSVFPSIPSDALSQACGSNDQESAV